MGKKSHTAAPSMNISTPSKSYHVNPGQLPKNPGIHGGIKNTGPTGKAYKPPKC
jgi:hypothetical protein